MDSAKHPGCGPDLGSDLSVLFPSKGPLRPWAAKEAGCSCGASSRKDGAPSLRADGTSPCSAVVCSAEGGYLSLVESYSRVEECHPSSHRIILGSKALWNPSLDELHSGPSCLGLLLWGQGDA